MLNRLSEISFGVRVLRQVMCLMFVSCDWNREIDGRGDGVMEKISSSNSTLLGSGDGGGGHVM